jgi:acyl-coenzyme A synthetase/AMP-(fatty) acid ligase
MRDYLKQKLMPYQVPVRVLQVDELPRTPSLKVNQPALSALLRNAAPAPARQG